MQLLNSIPDRNNRLCIYSGGFEKKGTVSRMKWFGWLLVCVDVVINVLVLRGIVYNIFRKDEPLTALRMESRILFSFGIMGAVFVGLTVLYIVVDAFSLWMRQNPFH